MTHHVLSETNQPWPTEPWLITPGGTIGGYRLAHRLYDAGDGRQVFATEADGPDRSAVIKLAPLATQPSATRLSREFSVHRQLAGDGVVTALGYGVSLPHQVEYLVLAAHGPSLAAVLAAAPQQRLELSAALAMAHSVAVAVGRLHEHGWCHGDLKPGNVLCDPSGEIHLSDLEFAVRLAEPYQLGTTELQRGGTPPFMAPELEGSGSPAWSPAADVWSLGVTVYLALFSEYPFGDGSLEAVQAAIAQGLPPRLDDVTAPLRDLFIRLLATGPRDRLADGRRCAEAVVRVAAELRVDLAAGTREFAGRIAAVADCFATPRGSSTVVPASVQPKTEVGTPPPARPASDPPTHLTPITAPPRPRGVGAAGDPGREQFLREVMRLDIASTALPPPAVEQHPPRAAAPAAAQPKTQPLPAPKPATAETGKHVTRRVAARWYRRMNPDRIFPLTVVISGRQIRIVGGNGLGVTLGSQELVLDSAEPVLNIEPWFPGCLVSPPQADVHCIQDTTVCRFWITPLVCGDLKEACVTIRYRGQIVETLATPSKVVTRTTAKVLATLGLISPVVGKTLHLVGWEADEFFRQTMPYLGHLIARLGMLEAVLLVTGGLLVSAIGYFHFTRPLLSDAEPGLFATAAQ